MNASVPNRSLAISQHDGPPDIPGVTFGRTADGLLAARVGDLVFAMVPGRVGHFLVSAWQGRRPLEQLKRDDFYSHHGDVADEAAFRARMCEQAEHSRELKALSRNVTRISRNTPWGASQLPPGFTLTASSSIRPPSMVVFTSRWIGTRRFTRCCGVRTAGTKRIPPGLSLQSPSRISSQTTSGAAPNAR